MHINPKISILVPNAETEGRYFSIRLQDDLKKEPVEFKQPQKVFVAAGIDGNFQSLCKLLVRGKVVDKYLQWNYADNHLVISGTNFNSSLHQITECLWLLYSLEEQARKKGGYVHFLISSQDIQLLNSEWRYMHPPYAEKNLSNALYNGNNVIWQWMKNKNLVEKVGKTLFVHGEISPSALEQNFSLLEINNKVISTIDDQPENQLLNNLPDNNLPGVVKKNFDDSMTEDEIDSILARFKVKTIVTGNRHIPGVTSYFNSKVINVNTKETDDMNNVVLIKNKRFYRLPDGRIENRERLK